MEYIVLVMQDGDMEIADVLLFNNVEAAKKHAEAFARSPLDWGETPGEEVRALAAHMPRPEGTPFCGGFLIIPATVQE